MSFGHRNHDLADSVVNGRGFLCRGDTADCQRDRETQCHGRWGSRFYLLTSFYLILNYPPPDHPSAGVGGRQLRIQN